MKMTVGRYAFFIRNNNGYLTPTSCFRLYRHRRPGLEGGGNDDDLLMENDIDEARRTKICLQALMTTKAAK